jgi:Zn-finger nucleic acid-binding protein
MNCKNCGAPMVPLPERDYSFCEYCGSFHFSVATGGGVRVLDESGGPDCPICQQELSVASMDAMRVLYCPKCRGILAEQRVFLALVEYQRARATRPPDRPRRLKPEDLLRQTYCPFCGQPMDTYPYYGPGNLVVDNCPRCDVIWLDYGELGIITNAPGPDHGWLLRSWYMGRSEAP